MLVSILHLSDIHVKDNHNVILSRINKIFDAVKNELLGKDKIFIVTTGDIAFSGAKNEYAKARTELYNPLFKLIHQYTKTELFLLFIPGNHDCEFNQPRSNVRKSVLRDIKINSFKDFDEGVIEICCGPQHNYFEFIDSIKLPNNGDRILKNKLLQITTFKINDHILKFNCYNTSWASELKEEIGQMNFPIDYIYEQIPPIESTVSISLLHHPFNWQSPENSKQFRQHLALTSDLIISGHEHSSAETIFGDFKEKYTAVHIESPALQDSDFPANSGFNLIDINLQERSININNFAYRSNGYTSIKNEVWKKLEHYNKLKGADFSLLPEFELAITNPGASFIHPSSDALTLPDIYVSANLIDINPDKQKKKQLIEFINSSDVLNLNAKEPESKNFILLLGNEGSGKTAMLKYHYKRLYDQGFYPIFINANDIDGVSRDKLVAFIKRTFLAQYIELESVFAAIDYNKIVLLIDDFHRLPFKDGKYKLLNVVKLLFSNIVITGNELMQYESYTKKDSHPVDVYEDFERYLIQEYGPTLRNQLINKWYRIGKDYLPAEDRNQFFKQVDEAENYITSIIGKNLIPSYPIYILSILQALASGVNDSADANLYGYYYEMLITKSLKKAVKNDEMGFYISLSKEYCFHLFDTKIRFSPLSLHDFKAFIHKHGVNYNIIDLNLEYIVEVLVKSCIVTLSADNFVSISYKYIYYYFVAKYLSDNIEEAEIRRTIDLMTERVYREEYSNIILFLTHLSKSKFIIENLIEKSRVIFKGIEPIKLQDDIGFINKLKSTIPELVIKDFEVDDSREDNIKSKEESEHHDKLDSEDESDRNEEYDLNEDLSSIDTMAYLTKAIRTLNILGQITRKYWGEMKGNNKFVLAEETFLLGLRTLKFYFGMLEGSQQTLIAHIKSIIDRKHVKEQISKIEVETITANLLFSLSSASTFGLIRRITNAIGSEKLANTFSDIAEAYPLNSVNILIASIKLDHYRSFPLKDIQTLVKVNENNPLAFVVLQNIVMDYLYMYDVPFERRQQIFDLLKIKIQHQRVIDATSTIKKE